ncbi:MAG: protease inhibitor Inh/omp19 family protein [Cohaesibacter sp.]|nr:protease inhibitor Inh/omp19 family protein [Cohaesibacter sp.]
MKSPYRCLLGVLAGLLVSGCASHDGSLSSSSDQVSGVASSSLVTQVALPPLEPDHETGLDSRPSDKFSQSEMMDLVVAQDGSQADQPHLEAYRSAEPVNRLSAQAVGVNGQMLGSWIVRSRHEEKMDRLSKLSAMARRLFDHSGSGKPRICEIELGSDPVEGGYKAQGSASCPTMLFMLDSWRPFGDKVILRNHMGDEILRLTSRAGDSSATRLWVGVDEQGQSFVFERALAAALADNQS